MIVAELISKLSEFQPDAQVECNFEAGYTEPGDPVLMTDGTVWIGPA